MQILWFLHEFIDLCVNNLLEFFRGGSPFFTLLNKVVDSMLQVVCIMIWGLDSELEHEDLLHTDWAWAHNVAKLLFCSELVEELLFQ